MYRDELENLVMEKIATMTKPADCGVIEKTTPVISFGDFTTSRIATLGINPSSVCLIDGATRKINPWCVLSVGVVIMFSCPSNKKSIAFFKSY